MVKEVSYIRLAIHQLKDILTQENGNCKGNYIVIHTQILQKYTPAITACEFKELFEGYCQIVEPPALIRDLLKARAGKVQDERVCRMR